MDGEGKKLSGQESLKHVETCHDSLGEELSRGDTTDHFGSCTICGLEAVQRAFCHFCQEHESHENHGCGEGHKNNIHAAHTQQQSTCSNSQDTQYSARPHFNAGTNDTCSVGIPVGREGDRGARHSWSVMQMKAHLAELQQKDQPISNGEMEVRIKALKKASNRRADLVNFLTKEGIPYSQHATIAQLYAKGEQAITEDYEPQGKELMGFGKFGGLTMEEVMDRHPSYMKWVVDTYQETDQFHWRLKRAAVYAMQAQAKKDYQEPHPQNTKSKKATPHTSAAGSEGSFEKVSEGKHEFSPTQSFQKTKHVSTDAETQIAELQLKIQQLENEKAEMELQAARSKNRKEM